MFSQILNWNRLANLGTGLILDNQTASPLCIPQYAMDLAYIPLVVPSNDLGVWYMLELWLIS